MNDDVQSVLNSLDAGYPPGFPPPLEEQLVYSQLASELEPLSENASPAPLASSVGDILAKQKSPNLPYVNSNIAPISTRMSKLPIIGYLPLMYRRALVYGLVGGLLVIFWVFFVLRLATR